MQSCILFIVTMQEAGREVNGLTAPVCVCWQLPCGVKHFVFSDVTSALGKTNAADKWLHWRQYKNTTDIIFSKPKQGLLNAWLLSIHCWLWPHAAKLWFSSFSSILTNVNSDVQSRCMIKHDGVIGKKDLSLNIFLNQWFVGIMYQIILRLAEIGDVRRYLCLSNLPTH